MATDARRPLFAHPWRVAIVVVVLAAVANLGVILLLTADSDEGGPELPSAVETVTPQPGDVTNLQAPVSVDLAAGLTGVLVVNGVEIPEDQLERGTSLGLVTFRPGPGKDFERWEAGDVAVAVRYWGATEPRPADPSSYSWRFRAAA